MEKVPETSTTMKDSEEPTTEQLRDDDNAGNPPKLKSGFKITQFWPYKPELWFARTESQFALENITKDDTKYNYVISSLDARCLDMIEDILLIPSDSPDRYNHLKTELVKRLSKEKELGKQKPSETLRNLKSLGGLDEHDMKTIWINRLPMVAQYILEPQIDKLGLDILAQLADKIYEHMTIQGVSTGNLHESARNPSAVVSKRTVDLIEMVSSISTRMDDLKWRANFEAAGQDKEGGTEVPKDMDPETEAYLEKAKQTLKMVCDDCRRFIPIHRRLNTSDHFVQCPHNFSK